MIIPQPQTASKTGHFTVAGAALGVWRPTIKRGDGTCFGQFDLEKAPQHRCEKTAIPDCCSNASLSWASVPVVTSGYPIWSPPINFSISPARGGRAVCLSMRREVARYESDSSQPRQRVGEAPRADDLATTH